MVKRRVWLCSTSHFFFSITVSSTELLRFFKHDRPVVIALLTQGQTVMIYTDIELHEEDITPSSKVKSLMLINM